MTEIETSSGDYGEREPIGELFGRPVYQYLIGARLSFGPENPGGERSKPSIRDVWAIDIGRLRISSGGGGGLLNNFDPTGERSPGHASLRLFDSSSIRVSLGLRLYSGRAQVDDGEMAGVPGLQRTVLGRLSTSFTLAGEWGGQVALTSDILGHGLGRELSFSLGRRWPLSTNTTMSVGLGMTFGDGEHMFALFGVPPGSAAADRLGSYEPPAGAKDLSAGFGLVTVLDNHWIIYGGISFAALLRSASDSPFVRRTVTNSLSLGLAYRCC
ncbi:MAG: MipA/OmpV family protein [Burkholderiaceae bacterium]